MFAFPGSTKHIYRWSPVRNGGRFNAHTVDEKLSE